MLHLVFSHKDDQAVLDKIKFDLKDQNYLLFPDRSFVKFSQVQTPV